MLNTDIIHRIAAYPDLCRLFFEVETISIDELKNAQNLFLNFNFSENDVLYLLYCLKRSKNIKDYNLLRKVLYNNTVNSQDIIEKKIRTIIGVKECKNINTIYDIGAGHDGYSKILKKIFPKAKIVMIDKNSEIMHNINKSSNFSIVISDIFEFLDSFKGSENILIWISEFLHCKKKNLDILDFPEIKKCHILINELDYDFFINHRLELSDGKIILPLDIYSKTGQIPFVKYSNMFNYKLFYYEPDNGE